MAGTNDTNQSVEVHMESDYKFKQIHIQGRDDAAEWVTSFRILYTDSNSTSNKTNWLEYIDGTGQNVGFSFFSFRVEYIDGTGKNVGFSFFLFFFLGGIY